MRGFPASSSKKNSKNKKCISGELLLLLLLFLGSHLTKKKQKKISKNRKKSEGKIGENRFLKIIKIIFGYFNYKFIKLCILFIIITPGSSSINICREISYTLLNCLNIFEQKY